MAAPAPAFTAPFPPSAAPVVVDPPASSVPAFLRPLEAAYLRFEAARDRLGLADPGKYEDLGREVKRASVHLSARPALGGGGRALVIG